MCRSRWGCGCPVLPTGVLGLLILAALVMSGEPRSALAADATSGSCALDESARPDQPVQFCSTGTISRSKVHNLTATVKVAFDDGHSGSVVELALRLAAHEPALPDGWQLGFTWLKATVLRPRPGTRTSGSYVELPPEPALAAGQIRTVALHIGPPAMRYASDLPQGLHVIIPRGKDATQQERVLPVFLVPPVEAHIRFDSQPPLFSGIVPRPLEVAVQSQAGFVLSNAGARTVQVLAQTPKADAAARLLQEWMATWPRGDPMAGGLEESPVRTLVLAEVPDANVNGKQWFGKEGYQVSISEKELRIEALEVDGFHRAAASLRQVLGIALAEGRSSVPTMQIRDRPAFGYRGLMLDAARHFFPVDFVKRLLDWMHLFKLNVFHWHLTDDEGWRLEVRGLPNLTARGAWRGRGEAVEPQYLGGPGRHGGFYSHEDVRDVVQYAADRGVVIVPEIDVPGHCYAAIRALPELLGAAVRRVDDGPSSVQGFRGNVLDPASPATYVFLETVFSEVVELFPAELGIHIGMDEIPRGAWSDEPHVEAALQAKLVRWLQDFLSARGRALLGWEEAFSGQAAPDPGVHPRGVAFAWKEDERSAISAAKTGFDVVLCPAHFLYLDIVQGDDFEERGLYWAAPQIRVDRVYSYRPMERLRRLGLAVADEHHVLGVQANLWSETVATPKRAEEMLFPRLLAVAEVAWTDASKLSWEDFQWRLAPSLVWLARELGVQYGGRDAGLVVRSNFLRVPQTSQA